MGQFLDVRRFSIWLRFSELADIGAGDIHNKGCAKSRVQAEAASSEPPAQKVPELATGVQADLSLKSPINSSSRSNLPKPEQPASVFHC
jgi:hypothetical protein